MKNLLSSLNLNQLMIYIVILVICIVAFLLIKKVMSNRKEKKLQENPSVLNSEHAGCFFKVKKVIPEKGIIFLSFNPSVNYPSGIGGGWFKTENIPVWLCNEYVVIEVNLNPAGDGIVITKHNLF